MQRAKIKKKYFVQVANVASIQSNQILIMKKFW